MYYHELNVGFNLWMVFAPVAVITAALAGISGAKIIGGREQKLYSSRFYAVLGCCLGVVLAGLLMLESVDGIVQFFDNGLASDESGIWSLIAAPIAIISVSSLFAAACMWLSLAVQDMRFRHLRSLRLQIAHYARIEYSSELTDTVEELHRELENYKLDPGPEIPSFMKKRRMVISG